MAVTVVGASIVSTGGGFVRWAVDNTEWRVRSGAIGDAHDPAIASAQVVQWCASSSIASTILISLRNAGFTVKQIGGGPEFGRSSGVSTDTPLTFWEARSS
jgi:hypothetical protein